MAKYEMTRIEMYLAWLYRLLIGPLMLLTNACAGCGGLSLNIVWVYQSQHTGPSLSSPAIRLVESWIYTEFIKKWRAGGRTWDWAPERGILELTEYLFIDFFCPKEPGISFSQRGMEDSITANHAIHATTTGAMLFSILICLHSMLAITHARPLPRVRHFYEFSVCVVYLGCIGVQCVNF